MKLLCFFYCCLMECYHLARNDSYFSSLTRIDRKMSSAHTNYKLDEAQAIMSELRSIKKAICTGEKERRDLMQVSGLDAVQILCSFVCLPACLSFI